MGVLVAMVVVLVYLLLTRRLRLRLRLCVIIIPLLSKNSRLMKVDFMPRNLLDHPFYIELYAS